MAVVWLSIYLDTSTCSLATIELGFSLVWHLPGNEDNAGATCSLVTALCGRGLVFTEIAGVACSLTIAARTPHHSRAWLRFVRYLPGTKERRKCHMVSPEHGLAVVWFVTYLDTRTVQAPHGLTTAEPGCGLICHLPRHENGAGATCSLTTAELGAGQPRRPQVLNEKITFQTFRFFRGHDIFSFWFFPLIDPDTYPKTVQKVGSNYSRYLHSEHNVGGAPVKTFTKILY